MKAIKPHHSRQGEKMTPQTKNKLDSVESTDHKQSGFLSCGGDEYQISCGNRKWEVDNALSQILMLIEEDNSISSFAILSGANGYDHVFTRSGEGWLIQDHQIENGVWFQETTRSPVSMTYLIDSYPDDWDELDWWCEKGEA
jgi:hypothetical protein